MKILGIDPGYGRCGFAVLDGAQQTPALVTFGVITTTPREDFSSRLLEIAEDFEALLDRHHPDVLSMEDLFFVENVTTGMQVAQVRGVLLYLAHKAGLRILEPKPVEIKQSFTGNGRASKVEMKKMVRMMFDLEASPKIDDAADAIAAAHYGMLLSGQL